MSSSSPDSGVSCKKIVSFTLRSATGDEEEKMRPFITKSSMWGNEHPYSACA